MADQGGKIFNRDIRLQKGCSIYVNDIQVVDGDGNLVAPVATTDLTTTGNTTIGNAPTDTLTVNAQIVGNLSFVKEANHTIFVATTTTAATVGGALIVTAGQGATTGAGGPLTMAAGASGTGATGNGGVASLTGGAALSTNGTGGDGKLIGGVGTGTAAGGAAGIVSGASANGTGINPGASGAVNLIVGAAGTATTGTAGAGGAINITGAAGGASTGASSTGGAGSDILVTAGAGGASSGGSDTGGRGGNVIRVAGTGGTGATAGIDGAFFDRANKGANYFRKAAAPIAKTTSATLTVAEVLGGWITVNQAGGATSTQTTPTGTQLVAACPAALAAGDYFDFAVINISTVAAEDAILGAGTDVSIVGNATVNSNDAIGTQSQGVFRFRYSGANVWVAYRYS